VDHRRPVYRLFGIVGDRRSLLGQRQCLGARAVPHRQLHPAAREKPLRKPGPQQSRPQQRYLMHRELRRRLA